MANYDPAFKIEDDLFCFETDQLALKGNQDYCEVLKTLVILAAQRERAVKDYKKIAEIRNEALSDPVETVLKIKNGDSMGIPPLFEIPKLPKVDFSKYSVKIPEEELSSIYSQTTAHESSTQEKLKPDKLNNKAWSPEEQKKLEELLMKYPPEPIEMRRFKKIAKELGNRTVQQVTSRVQKYFLKLYKAGLPIPGRIPKSVEKYKKSGLHKHQRHNHYLWKPTTFFPSLSVPVQMDDLENIPGPSTTTNVPLDNPTNYLLSSDYHQTTETNSAYDKEQILLNILQRAKAEKKKEMEEDYKPFYHIGYSCDYCNEDPIIGSRWHCTTCTDSVDFCTDCVLSQLYSENAHPLHHVLVVLRDEDERPIPITFVPSSPEKLLKINEAETNLEKFLNQNEEFSKDISDIDEDMEENSDSLSTD